MTIAEGAARTSVEEAEFEVHVPTPAELALRRARHHWGLLIGGSFVLLIVVIALFAPYLAPYDPFSQDMSKRLLLPVWAGGSWEHVLGTDNLGRDYLSRLIYGARVSIVIGFFSALVSAIVGSTVGMVGGYYGGRVDAFVMYLINVKLALPGILVALSLVSVFGGSMTVLVLTIAFLFWDRYAVVTRAITQQIRSSDYIAAAQSVGASNFRIIFEEVLPNVVSHIIVILSLEMAVAILIEAALSFLGLGVQPPTPSWGLMVAEARSYLFFRPSLIAIPGLAIFLLVMAINLMGDGIHDVTAPEGRT